MPYPVNYQRIVNFARLQASGTEVVDPASVDAELNSLAVALGQVNHHLRQISTADASLRVPPRLREMRLMEELRIVATAAQTVFEVLPVFDINFDQVAVHIQRVGDSVSQRLDPALISLTPHAATGTVTTTTSSPVVTFSAPVPQNVVGAPLEINGTVAGLVLTRDSATQVTLDTSWIAAPVVTADFEFVGQVTMTLAVPGGAMVGDIVLIDVFTDGQGVINRLASLAAGLGASLIGIEDVDAQFVSSTVEEALKELKTELSDYITLVGDLANYLRLSDGTYTAAGPLNMDGNVLTGLIPAVLAGQPVTLGQLQGYIDLWEDLASGYLALSGGTMSGQIDMGGFKIIGQAAPTDATDGANKAYVDAQVQTVATGRLAVIGLEDSPEAGTITGPVTLGALASAVADADQTTSPVDVVVPTLIGVPRPAAGDHVASRAYVEDAIALAVTSLETGEDLDPAGLGFDLAGLGTPVGQLTPAGQYHFTTLIVNAPQSLTGRTEVYASESLTVSATISMSAGATAAGAQDIDGWADKTVILRSAGNITISAAVTLSRGRLIIETPGVVTINAAIAAYNGVRIVAGGGVEIGVSGSINTYTAGGRRDAVGIGSVEIVAGAASSIAGAVAGVGIYVSVIGDLTCSGSLRSSGSLVRQMEEGAQSTFVDPSWFDHRGGHGGYGASGAGGGRGQDGTTPSPKTALSPFEGSVLPPRSYMFQPQPGVAGGLPWHGTYNAGYENYGGGVIDMYATGDLTITGAVLNADASRADNNGANDAAKAAGGGGGGWIRLVCGGTMSGGALSAVGGAGGQVAGSAEFLSHGGGGGGGGAVSLLAAVYGVAPSVTNAVLAGAGRDGGSAGAAGWTDQLTLPSASILALNDFCRFGRAA